MVIDFHRGENLTKLNILFSAKNIKTGKTPAMYKINGLIHQKNTILKHRTQSRFRPVIRHFTGVHPVVMIYGNSYESGKSLLNGTFSGALPREKGKNFCSIHPGIRTIHRRNFFSPCGI